MNRDVVITGMGAVTPIGSGLETFWKGLLEGRNGIDEITLFDAREYPCRIAAEVKDWDPSVFMSRKKARRMARCAQFAVAASQLCLEDAQWRREPPSSRTAVVGSISNSAQEILDRIIEKLKTRGYHRLSPRSLPMTLPHSSASEVGAVTGFQGEVTSVTNACAAGLYAVGHAANLIRAGKYDAILCPATEASITYTTLGSFARAGLLSVRNDEPEKASRPFDAKRDGGIIGEGAACFLLESEEHARKRAANVYAQVNGFGCSESHGCDTDEGTQQGMMASMREALVSGNCSPAHVGYVGANGVSDPDLDRLETAALKELFQEEAYRTPVSSVKAQVGIALNVAGALQLIASVMALNTGILPPTRNYEYPDPACDLDYIPGEPRHNAVSHALVHAHGMNGSNASLLITKAY